MSKQVCREESMGIEEYWAFDYESQAWVRGERAVHLLVQQVQAELSILHSDRGSEYYAMIKEKGGTKSKEAYMAELEGLMKGYFNELMENMEFLR